MYKFLNVPVFGLGYGRYLGEKDLENSLAKFPSLAKKCTEFPSSLRQNWNIGSISSKSLILKGKTCDMFHFYIRTSGTH